MKISKNAENCLLNLDPQVLTSYVNKMSMTVGEWGGRYVKWVQGEQEHLFSLKYLLKIIETKKQSAHLGQIIQSFKKLNLKGETQLKKAFWWIRLLTWLRRINLLEYSWKKEVAHIEKSIVSTNPLPPQNNNPTHFQPILTNLTEDKKKQQTTEVTTVHLSPKLVAEELKKLLGTKKLCLCVTEYGGFGDLICGARWAKQLHNKVGFPEDQILIVSNSASKLKKLVTHLKANVLTPEGYHAISREEVGIQFVVPVIDREKQAFLKDDIPTFRLAEYENRLAEYEGPHICPSYPSMGIGKRSLGILIDDELTKASFPYPNDPTSTKSNALKKVSPYLLKAILGKEPTKDAFENFFKTNKLYTSYAHSYHLMAAYFVLVSYWNKTEKGDFFVIFPGGHTKKMLDPTYLEAKPKEKERLVFGIDQNQFRKDWRENLVERLKKTGNISKLRILITEKGKIEEHILYESEIGDKSKVMTIVTGNVIPHHDMRFFFLSSEKECLITGDMSLTDAISTNRVFVYECYKHKENLGKKLQKRYGKMCLELGTSMSSCPSKAARFMFTFFENQKKDNYRKVSETNEKIVKENNAFPEVCKKLVTFLKPKFTRGLAQKI